MKLNYLKEWLLNPRAGMASFLLMRITGIGLVLYVFLHLYSLGAARIAGGGAAGKAAFDGVMSAYNTPLFHAVEYALLLCVLLHMFNGIRIVLLDWLQLTRSHRPMFWGAIALVAAVALVSFAAFFPELVSR
jgi:succinate dehydrogenase / fumarate reductase cytochrome b subunit